MYYLPWPFEHADFRGLYPSGSEIFSLFEQLLEIISNGLNKYAALNFHILTHFSVFSLSPVVLLSVLLCWLWSLSVSSSTMFYYTLSIFCNLKIIYYRVLATIYNVSLHNYILFFTVYKVEIYYLLFTYLSYPRADLNWRIP